MINYYPIKLKVNQLEEKLNEKQKEIGFELWNCKIDEDLKAFKHQIKEFLKKEQQYRCAFCKQEIIVTHNAVWDIEHIVSKKQKPDWMFEIKNLVLCCKDCNTKKGEKNTIKKTILLITQKIINTSQLIILILKITRMR